MTRYGMAIDLNRCIGCHTCSVACKMANNLPKNMWWNRVMTNDGYTIDSARTAWPQGMLEFTPVACQHCENPVCVKVCPVGATYKDPDTGIVRQDADKCIGCRMCMSACPYNGVRSFNWEEPAAYYDFAVGDGDAPEHQKHTVEKCTFCYQRTSQGEEPACMHLCPERARYWGDLDDPESAVSRAIEGRSYQLLLEEMGTKPSVYYLV